VYLTQIRRQKTKHNFKKITETRPRFSPQTAASSSQLFKLSAANVVSLDIDLLLKRRAKKSSEDDARKRADYVRKHFLPFIYHRLGI
jgi:hypothetical protein